MASHTTPELPKHAGRGNLPIEPAAVVPPCELAAVPPIELAVVPPSELAAVPLPIELAGLPPIELVAVPATVTRPTPAVIAIALVHAIVVATAEHSKTLELWEHGLSRFWLSWP